MLIISAKLTNDPPEFYIWWCRCIKQCPNYVTDFESQFELKDSSNALPDLFEKCVCRTSNNANTQ